MQPGSSHGLSDKDYKLLWDSLQNENENHLCSRQCEFKQVFGNMFYCLTSGQAHVCDQNCTQRIFYDNSTDICRLSRRQFPHGEAGMTSAPKKRTGEEAGQLCHAAKRPQSGDLQQQHQHGNQHQLPAGDGDQSSWQPLPLQQVAPQPGWPAAQG